MITGDEMITSGEVYLNDINIKNDLRQVKLLVIINFLFNYFKFKKYKVSKKPWVLSTSRSTYR